MPRTQQIQPEDECAVGSKKMESFFKPGDKPMDDGGLFTTRGDTHLLVWSAEIFLRVSHTAPS